MTRPIVAVCLAIGLCIGAVLLLDIDRSTPPPRSHGVQQPRGAAAAVPAGSGVGRASGSGQEANSVVQESSGPWGSLQSYPVLIAAPDSILDDFPVPSAVTVWTFVGLAAPDVAALIDLPGLPETVRDELLDRRRWQMGADDRIQVFPSPAAVRTLPPDVRAGIYNVLARWEENEFQHSPYYVPDEDVRGWMKGAGLRTELVDLVARTSYPVGNSLCFSDLPLVVSITTSHAEARSVLKALSRTQTAILRLRLDTTSDIESIRSYWSSGDVNAKDFLPLLESVATNPLINHLDVVHVLPPNVRRLLYTFPRPAMAVAGRYPDCHWTSLNFFNERTEPRLADVAGATMFARENYRVGEPPHAFGDVLFMTDSQANAIHSCVYLADDYVFTKNGANVVSPWVIMKLDDVRDRYSRHGPVNVVIYRRVRQAG